MKNLIATILGIVFAVSFGTVFAGNTDGNAGPDMQMPPSAAQQKQPAASCNSKYPSFDQLDSKHQGYITKKEAGHVSGLAQAFKKIDKNHNGKLDQSEYMAWVQSKCAGDQQSQGQMMPPPL